MFMRGNWNYRGQHSAGERKLVDDFTWSIAITKAGDARARVALFAGRSKAYGVHADRGLLHNFPTYNERHKAFEIDRYMSGAGATRRRMVQRKVSSKRESSASGAEFATELWVSSACSAEAPSCPISDNTQVALLRVPPPRADHVIVPCSGRNRLGRVRRE